MNHTIQNSKLCVTAAEHGAELQSILSADGREYLWQGDPKFWKNRALNIFPYVARLTEGSYYLDGQRYQMPIHGIAPYRDFRLVSKSDTRMVLELCADQETLGQYPRQFCFRVIYTLLNDTLEICFEVENRDEKIMYFGLGGHPGFCLPLAEGKCFEDYRLRFGSVCQPQRVGFNAACFVTGEHTPFELEDGQILHLRHDLFDDDAIVLTHMDRQVTLETEGDTHGVTVRFPQMQYLGIWHAPKKAAPYVCIEPWCSLPSAAGQVAVFEEQPDLISLQPGKSYQNRWSIQIF